MTERHGQAMAAARSAGENERAPTPPESDTRRGQTPVFVEACQPASAVREPLDRKALISARDITVRRNDRDLLHGVDIDIRPGEIVTLIGPNGAGKTTLVRVLLGLDRPDNGEIFRQPDLVIGYTPQRFAVDRALPMTAGRFLALGYGGAAQRVPEILGELGIGAIEHRQLSLLSGGELQRLVLARALMRDPGLLVLDEPVRGIDYTGEAELYALIGRLRQSRGLGVLLVSHDLHVVMAQSDRVVCLNRHVCCSGVPEAVSRHAEYVRLFGADAARAFAVYTHHHDHRHGLGGEPSDDDGAAGHTTTREGSGP